MNYIDSLHSDDYSFTQKLQIWAKEAIKYCHPIAETLDRAFYAFQSEPVESPELLLLGLNPGGDFNYGNVMFSEAFLQQNPWYFGGHNYDPKAQWNILNKLQVTKSVTPELDKLFNDMVYMNLLYFNSIDFSEFISHAKSKNINGQEVFDKCSQLTKELIFNIIKPKRIICFSIDNCFNRLNSENATVSEIIPRLLHYTTIQGIKTYGIRHPSARYSNLDRQRTGYYLSHEIFKTEIPATLPTLAPQYIKKITKEQLAELRLYLQKEIKLESDGQLHFTANNGDELSLRVCACDYIGFRARHKHNNQNKEWNDGIQKEHYVPLLFELGFITSITWLGVKYFKNYNFNTIEELGKEIVIDFTKFKNKME